MSIKVIVETKKYKKKFYDKKEDIADALKKKGYDEDDAFAIADSAAEKAGYKELKEEEILDEKRKKRKKRKKKKKKGKKDACYHKVRARYDVWPSAYASGALVKCRKVGAKNWGNKSKKTNEELISDIENLLEEADMIIEEAINLDEKKRKKKRKKKSKLTSKPSSEKSLHHWFARKGAKGGKGGWVDCNAPDGKGGYKSCGRGSGEKRKRYPACRPTAGACKKYKGSKGKSWGKKDSKKRGKRK